MMAWDNCPYLAMIDIRHKRVFRRQAFMTETEAKSYIQQELGRDNKKKRGVRLLIKNVLNGRIVLDEKAEEA